MSSTELKQQAVASLVAMARAAWVLLDGMGGEEGYSPEIDDIDKLGEAMDQLDKLPDELNPNVTMQGPAKAEFILLEQAEHGWVCYNGGPGSMFWSPSKENLEHELTEDLRPATALEKTLFYHYGLPTPTGFELPPVNARNSETLACDYDGFVGTVQGRYRTREGKDGIVLQQIDTKVVHVYGESRLQPVE